MRRTLTAIGASVAALALLAGCSAGGAGEQPADGKVTLEMWSWDPGMADIVDVWNSENPDIQVKLSDPAGGDELVSRILTAHKSGDAADIVKVEYQSLPALIANGVAADITEYVPDAAKDFTPGAFAQVEFEDKTYGLPQTRAARLLLPPGHLRAVRPEGPDHLGRVCGDRSCAARRRPLEVPRHLQLDRPGLVHRAHPAGRRQLVERLRRDLDRRHRRRRLRQGRRLLAGAHRRRRRQGRPLLVPAVEQGDGRRHLRRLDLRRLGPRAVRRHRAEQRRQVVMTSLPPGPPATRRRASGAVRRPPSRRTRSTPPRLRSSSTGSTPATRRSPSRSRRSTSSPPP